MNLIFFLAPIALVVGMIGFVVSVNLFSLWLQCLLSGAHIDLARLIVMRLKKVRPATIVEARITAAKAGLNLSVDELEALYLAGGDVQRVVSAVIAANKAEIPLSVEQATAMDLAGEDVLEHIRLTIYKEKC
ncbi:MAG: flotillin-like FloA family protein [Candidatus Hydrogenedentes bacterium]|nr:flotillin-like FloA family protein [Candidatus Hydrogenedentota bacterium]